MKVGLLTFHFGENYGSVLQAYAIQQAVRRLGHDVDIIDYWPRYITHGGRLRLPTSKRNLRINAQIAYVRWTHRRAYRGRDALGHLFDTFRDKHLSILPPRIWRDRDLRRACGEYEVIVCGSDQIWNPPTRAASAGMTSNRSTTSRWPICFGGWIISECGNSPGWN